MKPDTIRKRRRIVECFVAWASDKWPTVKDAGGVDRACASAFGLWLYGEGTRGKTRRNLIGDLGAVWEGLRRVRDDVTQNP